MSDSARHALYSVLETEYGVTPETPAFRAIRHTGTTLGLTKSTMLSEELRADRQISDFRHGTKQTGGDVNTELSYGSHDPFFEAVLCGTWTPKNAPYAAATISAEASDNSFNDTAAGFPALSVGDKISVAGFTTAGNNGVARVVSRTASKIVVSGLTLTDEALGDAVTITTLVDVLKAGVVRRSFSILRHFSDLLEAAKPFHLFRGVELNTLNLTVGVNALVTANFGTVGQGMNAPAGTAPAGSTYVAANSLAVMDSFTGSIYQTDAATCVITELTATLENGIEPRFTVCADETIKPSIGRSNLTGQVTAYFEDSTFIDKFIAGEDTSLSYLLGDKVGNGYRVTYPKIKYNGGQPDTQGQGAITLSIPFQAIYDPVTGTQIIIERIRAAA